MVYDGARNLVFCNINEFTVIWVSIVSYACSPDVRPVSVVSFHFSHFRSLAEHTNSYTYGNDNAIIIDFAGCTLSICCFVVVSFAIACILWTEAEQISCKLVRSFMVYIVTSSYSIFPSMFVIFVGAQPLLNTSMCIGFRIFRIGFDLWWFPKANSFMKFVYFIKCKNNNQKP